MVIQIELGIFEIKIVISNHYVSYTLDTNTYDNENDKRNNWQCVLT